jgi:hypothetical protein
MKNIHILPTTKSTGLYKNLLTDKLFILENSFMDVSECNREYQNIYITSDEEIKVGDWFLTPKNDLICANIEWRITISRFIPKTDFKKIIITTDQDLIKDGVQSIDDEFLQWFVKNPSCEVVEVIYEPKNFLDTKQGWEYTIIIPKKIGFKVENGRRTETFYQEPKQETLEKYIENYNKLPNGVFKTYVGGYIDGAKWQQKRMYSEEDMKRAFNVGFQVGYNDETSPSYLTAEKFIKQFKKK